MWVPPEIKDPVLQHAPTRKSVACFGAVSLSSGKFVRAMCSVFNGETFEAFLKRLLRHRSRGKRMLIVVDNAKYHHSVSLAPFLRRYRNVLSLLFLPPYSPQLAPIERVWTLSHEDSPPTTGTSRRSRKCSMRSALASTGGNSPIRCWDRYAALFKTLCLAA